MIYTKDVTQNVREPKTKFGSNLKCRILRHVTARLDRICLRISVEEVFEGGKEIVTVLVNERKLNIE